MCSMVEDKTVEQVDVAVRYVDTGTGMPELIALSLQEPLEECFAEIEAASKAWDFDSLDLVSAEIKGGEV